MNSWLIVGILPIIIAVGDYVYVRYRVYNIRSIIQTLQIADMEDNIIDDLFHPEPKINKINKIFITGINIAYTHNKLSLNQRINALNNFVEAVSNNVGSNVIKNNIKNVCRTPYFVCLSDFIWLHQLAYIYSTREKFTKSAYSALFYFLMELEHNCTDDMQQEFYLEIGRTR
jgi:hypothetical protein